MSSPDPCRLVNFLGFAGLAVCCRNAAYYLPSDRAPRDCEVIGAILGADEGITLIAKLVEIWVICPNVLRELELADEAGAYHERRDPTISSILKRTFR